VGKTRVPTTSILGLMTDVVLPVLTQLHCFLLVHFLPPSLIFTLVRALLLQSSLLLTLSFSLSLILSCILSRFLAHVLIGTWCSPSRVVLLLYSHCFCGFTHSIFTFFGFDRFRSDWFPFTDFALPVYKRYVFLSLYACNVLWILVL